MKDPSEKYAANVCTLLHKKELNMFLNESGQAFYIIIILIYEKGKIIKNVI